MTQRSSRQPSTEFPTHIHYNGGLHANLYHHSHKNVAEPYWPCMPLKSQHNKADSNCFTTAIVLSIPICNPEGSIMPYQYILQLHDSTTITKTLSETDEIAD